MIVPVPTKALARLREAQRNYLLAKAYFEDMLNAVAEAVGVDTDIPGTNLDAGLGVFIVPDPAEPGDSSAAA